VSQNFDLGVHYFLRQKYSEAAQRLRDEVREDPENGAAWAYYGISLAHLGLAADAERALSHAVELSPQNPDAWFHLGVARSLREEWGLAATAYRHAVALTPDDMVAWHRLGVALAESGEEIAASVAFERALVLSREIPGADPLPPPLNRDAEEAAGPDDHVGETGEREGAREAKSWLDLALSLLSLGDMEEAVAAYERAYTLDSERAQRSLFHPMLRLLTAVEGEPSSDLDEDDRTDAGPAPNRDRRPPLPPSPPSGIG
jgi:tetratricopeptide (TPR) repeat protein